MAKRYHHLGNEFYAGNDERRKQERMDGSMMPMNTNAHANMPTEVIMRDFPGVHEYTHDQLNDSISGIDQQVKADTLKRKQDQGKY